MLNPLFMAPIFAQATDRWTEVFFGLDQEQRFALMIVGIACGTGIILGLAGIIYSALDGAHRRRLEAEMKRDLVERGMTADEIAKIIESSTSTEAATARWIGSWGKCKKP